MNSTNEIKLRKYENILRITGAGVLVFGVWSLAKILIYIFLGFSEIEKLFGDEIEIEYRNLAIGIMLVFLLIDVAIRLYIAKHAVYEAKGIKRGYAYIILAGLLVLSSAFSLYVLVGSPDELFDSISDLVTELTSMCISIELIVSSLYVKKLSKTEYKQES